MVCSSKVGPFSSWTLPLENHASENEQNAVWHHFAKIRLSRIVCAASFSFFFLNEGFESKSPEHAMKTNLLQQPSLTWSNHSFDILYDLVLII